MKTWEFRNILIDLNDIEKLVLALTSTLPDFVVLRKIAEIRLRLLRNYKTYESAGSPLIDDENSKEARKDTDSTHIKWCVEVPDKLGGNLNNLFDGKYEAEEFARNMNIRHNLSESSPKAYRVEMKYVKD